jgi:hypothetical protein
MQMRGFGAAVGGGGLFSALIAAGWAGAVLAAAVVLTLVGAVCWVVADPDRPGRLALLIDSWRSGGRGQALRRPLTDGRPNVAGPRSTRRARRGGGPAADRRRLTGRSRGAVRDAGDA